MRTIDRYCGALVGVLAGDALGAPYETWSEDRIAADFDRRGGLVPFDYPDPWGHKTVFPAGRPTDDSDQTAALALSLIACNKVNQEDIYARLRKTVVEHKSPLWDGKAIGAGRTTRDALSFSSWEESRDSVIPPEKIIPSNGALMRSAPLALLFGALDSVNEDAVSMAGVVTHRHPLALASALEYVHILASVLDDFHVEDAVTLALCRPFAHLDEELVHVFAYPEEEPIGMENPKRRGGAVLTLHVALWAACTTTNFRDGITKAISVGGDTDTYAAVAGGLLGAHYGIEGIPEEWRAVLQGREVMERLASDLYALRERS